MAIAIKPTKRTEVMRKVTIAVVISYTPTRIKSSRTGNCFQRPALRVGTQSVEEQRVRCERLGPVLRAKTEQNHASLAHRDFHQRGFAFDSVAAEQPAGKQRIFVFR